MTVPKRPAGRVYLDDVDHLLSFGLSLEAIAERLGVKVDSIQQALRRREKREAEAAGESGVAA
ncbi:hypothetical protein [Pseudonocardia zijingensis]|uniref:Sigma-70-like protein n=1 Tax=Pseudonocardia zijingensis TaxID=153376 RepID=A0ABN1N903_9PSEU